ncbi:lysophospholipid acyltransferase family protein [Nocardioides donggukensis]|uniref:1-acyl-sn-glycerol-3-phosphate acyltransferase n=1 Tax=Nocardioides donggukensis TaxID=2774019 RepID=A0A927K7W5_9ACTN|nr:lysophospholipid acyltransferase family protein [Nocardioides donggukensis]MBD8869290.1 1-acyl-sn-glycerol-3-phosphate acyltransferase [Nocardioides donggukensis]
MNRRRPRAGAHAELPRTLTTPHPRRYLLHPLRPAARWIVRRRVPVRVHGADRVPATGPVIFSANHIGVVDGPLLAIFSPRPVHALTKVEMFHGLLGRFLHAAGQIPVDRFVCDPAAVKACLVALREGATVGIFPEGRRGSGELVRFHRGAAYLALVSGAPVVPVTFLGSRAPGAGPNALPPRDGHVDIVYGAPYTAPQVGWPRTREHVEQTSLLLREHMSARLTEALALTGRQLPGPLPPGTYDDDPDTGVLEQGAS